MGGKWRWTHFWKSLFLIFHSRHFLDFLPKFIKNHQNCRGFWRIWDFGAWTNGQVNRVLHQRPKTTRTSPRKNCDRRPFRWESGGLSVDSGGKYHEDVDLMGYAWGNGVDNMWQNGTYMYIYIYVYIYIYISVIFHHAASSIANPCANQEQETKPICRQALWLRELGEGGSGY